MLRHDDIRPNLEAKVLSRYPQLFEEDRRLRRITQKWSSAVTRKSQLPRVSWIVVSDPFRHVTGLPECFRDWPSRPYGDRGTDYILISTGKIFGI